MRDSSLQILYKRSINIMNVNDFCKATESPIGSLVGAAAATAVAAGVASGIKHLKNKNNKKNQPETKQNNKSEKLEKISSDDFKKLTPIFKEATNAVWKQTKNSSDLKNSINDYNSDYPEDKYKVSDIVITCKPEPNNYDDPYFMITNNGDIDAYLSWILKDIIKYAEQKHPEIKQYVFGTGDGDEGCIYIEGKRNKTN